MELKYLDTTTELTGDVVKVVMTKEIADRDGEVVKVDGVDVENFQKNPIVLWGHRSFGGDIEDVVGRADNLRVETDMQGVKMLTCEVMFADHPKAQYLKQMVKKGIITSLSIGFQVPMDGYDAKTKTINKWELLELSFVNIPANPEANVVNLVKEMKGSVEEKNEIFKKLAVYEKNKSILKSMRELFLGEEICTKFEYQKSGVELEDIKNIFDRVMERIYIKAEEVETPQIEVETQPEAKEPEVKVLSKDELKELLFNN